MFRGLIAIVTAAAVFWHAVAGCCAHHGHEGACCEGSGTAPRIAVQTGSEANQDCCQRAHADSGLMCASESPGQQLGEDSPVAPCPDEGPAGCSEGSCVFTASDSSGPSLIEQHGWESPYLGFAVVEPAILRCDSSAGELLDSVAPPLLGGLRLHLALCVLTL